MSESSRRRKLESYYTANAESYDAMHVRAGDEHFVALEYVVGLLASLRVQSVLDVGAGTGRALHFLHEHRPELRLVGVEPVAALRELAVDIDVRPGIAERLEFADQEFDAVLATALLHHVEDPDRVIREMCRVAQRAVFLSDINRYGFGSPGRRLAKRALGRSGRYDQLIRLRGGGSRRLYSEGDGYHYSYSALDSVAVLKEWAERVFVIPTRGGQDEPLTVENATHVLVVATRDTDLTGWAGGS
jgi:SAM-dependent methyltransferase